MAEANGTRWTGELRRFLREFAAYAGGRGAVAAVTAVAAAVFEGLGLILIVPLLGIVIASPHLGGRLETFSAAMFASLGIERPAAQLMLLLAVFSVLMIVRALVISARDVKVAGLLAGFVEARRARIVQSLAAARWDRLAQLRHARVTHIMSADIARIGAMAHQTLQCAIAVTLLIVQGVLVFLLAPALASIVLCLLIFAAVLLVPGIRRTHAFGGTATNASISLLGLTGNFLGGLKLALSQNLQTAFVAEFRQTLRENSKLQIDAMRQQTQRRLALTTCAAIVAAAVVLIGFGVFDVAPQVLIALLLIMTRMVGPAGQIQQSVQQIAFALPAFEKVTELERDLAALPGETILMNTAGSVAEGPIVFHDVSFHHRDESDGAERGVSHVSVTILPGELVGVAGPSGAGKTTFADLLVGLFPPLHGRITIGGMALTGAALPAWQDQISYISQDPFLFHDSVRRNLSWANPTADEAELWRALAFAGADDVVRRMAQGLDTIVGERGALVSGGERQRIALARAVLRKPRLLVLDEATNALDVAGERDIVARLRALVPRATIVIIAHRPETIALCDRVLHFDAGRCVDDAAAMPRIMAQQ